MADDVAALMALLKIENENGAECGLHQSIWETVQVTDHKRLLIIILEPHNRL
jgi:hypothetical protein